MRYWLFGRWRTSNVGAEFRNPGRRSVGLLIRIIAVRLPERREVPAEVQFEVAPNTVTDVPNLRTARLRTWQGQQWEEQVVARLKLGSCRRPEPIDLGLRRG
jgi:hypothetical protein